MNLQWLLTIGNEAWDNYRISKVQTDLSFEVKLRVNGAIRIITTKWDLNLFGKWIIFINNIIIFVDWNDILLIYCLHCAFVVMNIFSTVYIRT